MVSHRPATLVAALLASATLLAGCQRASREAPEEAGQRSGTQRPSPRLAGSPQRPNIILVTLDTLRADRLSCYGASRPSTPHIDRLAEEGARFTNAATTVPFTLPSHSSIMTGVYPPRHGVRENVGYALDDSLPTLAETLGAAGWRTAAFVSAFVLDRRWGIGRGFSTYFDDFDLEEGERANLGAVQRDGRETVDEAVSWLDEGGEGPFFLWLHLFDAHDPYTPPEPFKSRYPSHPYEAEVAYVDSLVGRFVEALDERRLLSDTWIVLTGDHGEGLGQHEEGFHGFFIYDSTVHVPLVVRAPEAAGAGRVIDRTVSHVDLMPTLLEIAGVTAPPGLQGHSLLPLLAGAADAAEEASDRDGERVAYSESLYPLLHYGWAPLRSLRVGSLKYIEAPRPELYDLAADPGERENILRRDRRLASEMKDRLAAMVETLEGAERAEQRPAPVDDETLARLQALGYAAGRGRLDPDEEHAAPRADPKDRIELHQLVMAAQSALGAGELDRAEERLERALAVDASIVEANSMLGEIAAQRGAPEEALDHFRAALALDAEMPSALLGMARAYRELGKLDEALVGFERLLELDPEDPQATLAVCDIQQAQGRPEEALATLERVDTWKRPAAIVLNRLGERLTELGRPAEAGERFRRAIEENPDLAQPYFNLAVLAEESDRIREAVALYEQAIERAPGHYQAQFNLGRLYGLLGDAERQQALYEAAVESNPDFARGYFFLAKALLDRGGDLARAESLAREGIERDREHRAGPLGYYVLADILNRLGRPEDAARAAAEGRRLEARQSQGL